MNDAHNSHHYKDFQGVDHFICPEVIMKDPTADAACKHTYDIQSYIMLFDPFLCPNLNL